MKSRFRFLLPLLFISSLCFADVEIVLKNDFIEKYKNKVTIDAQFFVDKAHERPNPPSKDSDLHIAGRSPDEIQLPIVAEIMNANDAQQAMDIIHQAEGDGTSIRLTGAWRIWTEHAGEPQVQGDSLTEFNTTNPDHVFEIHPVTKVKDENLLHTLKEIEGFKTKDAYASFIKYENQRSVIDSSAQTTTITTPMAGYNYVEFVMQTYTDDQFVVSDGRFVYGNALTLDGDFLAYKRRMVFLKGSEPENRVKNLRKGECIHVLGIPRMNLALVSWRSRNASTRPESLRWTLPYEILVVGVYDDQPECEQ